MGVGVGVVRGCNSPLDIRRNKESSDFSCPSKCGLNLQFKKTQDNDLGNRRGDRIEGDRTERYI